MTTGAGGTAEISSIRRSMGRISGLSTRKYKKAMNRAPAIQRAKVQAIAILAGSRHHGTSTTGSTGLPTPSNGAFLTVMVSPRSFE